MFCTSGATFENIVLENAKTDAKLLANMREAAHRTLFNFANSAAMNGLTSDAKIVPITPWYTAALNGMIIGSAVLFVGSAALMFVQTFKSGKKED